VQGQPLERSSVNRSSKLWDVKLSWDVSGVCQRQESKASTIISLGIGIRFDKSRE
jgi:hypothetical protein